VDSNSSLRYSKEELDKKLKPEVKEICKKENIKTTNMNKSEMIQAYIEKIQNPEKEEINHKLPDKFVEKPEAIHIRKNKYGNLEHLETNFVFDENSKKVIGVQLDDGTIKSLSKNDLNICNKYNFNYETPENLEDDIYFKNEHKDDDEVEEDEFIDEEEEIDIEEDEEFDDEEEFEEEF
jgi:hypothetical protein